MPKSAEPPPRWHAALSYAVLGRVPDGLSEPGRVDMAVLLADLERSADGLDSLRAEIARRPSGERWPHPVPAELLRGLGPAQFASALTVLRQRLEEPTAAVRSARDLDADERRLQADVPPHHDR